ncbi:DUF4280 domain-containing protein [Cedecea sp.]|jgi:uncharacterized Zn-binding protein involved in type VI secretion|uniref:DUF4280 domain-containing protein n=1 Tax=Cedecea sp. TaxID=1970739 RepID=UPI002F3FA6D4
MKNIVANGAILKCTQGTLPSPLIILPQNRIFVEGNPAANIMDNKPMVNIFSFGMCNSKVNPAVIAATAAATAAAMGVLTPTPAPCVPMVIFPWEQGAEKTQIAGMPALNKNSTCQCSWIGKIEVIHPGSLRTQIA